MPWSQLKTCLPSALYVYRSGFTHDEINVVMEKYEPDRIDCVNDDVISKVKSSYCRALPILLILENNFADCVVLVLIEVEF